MKCLNSKYRILKRMAALVAFILVFALAGVACAETNPKFSKIFTDQGIFHMNGIFFMMDSEAYAIHGDGYTECLEFGYKDDKVCSYINTVYWDIRGLSAEEIANLDTYVRDLYSFVESMENAKVSFTDINTEFLKHYKFVLSADNLDKPQILRELVNAGVLSMDEGSYISMSMTDEALISQGYTKR